ncbi:bacteriocin-type signal sequence domain-containing protein [Campylobacter concisus]|jgi:bacteriocin-type signal sequence domain protein|uniref:bacteriocin-type signal sequence domain-containing protein n=1 Tax=Campylobacter concisus TaxID=199 RepID=UPI000CD849FF|nr:bacteriocin-type signal sequence domain-containing protein [Campylobacter concisus]
MKNIFKVALLGGLLVASSNAKDILDLATNGTIDRSEIKALTDAEMKNVKGGYILQAKAIGNNEIVVFAIPTLDASDLGLYQGDEIRIDKNGEVVLDKSGICGPNETQCYMYPDTKTHYNVNKNRFLELMKVVKDPTTEYIAYSVKRNIGVEHGGKRFVYFTYNAGYVSALDKEFHRSNSSSILNNNTLIKEMRDNYKNDMESALGGYVIKN